MQLLARLVCVRPRVCVCVNVESVSVGMQMVFNHVTHPLSKKRRNTTHFGFSFQGGPPVLFRTERAVEATDAQVATEVLPALACWFRANLAGESFNVVVVV